MPGTRDVVLSYLERVRARDGWADLLSDDLEFTNFSHPVKRTTGKAAGLEGIARFYGMVDKMEVRSIIVEGQQACALTRYELRPPSVVRSKATSPRCSWCGTAGSAHSTSTSTVRPTRSPGVSRPDRSAERALAASASSYHPAQSDLALPLTSIHRSSRTEVDPQRSRFSRSSRPGAHLRKPQRARRSRIR